MTIQCVRPSARVKITIHAIHAITHVHVTAQSVMIQNVRPQDVKNRNVL